MYIIICYAHLASWTWLGKQRDDDSWDYRDQRDDDGEVEEVNIFENRRPGVYVITATGGHW